MHVAQTTSLCLSAAESDSIIKTKSGEFPEYLNVYMFESYIQPRKTTCLISIRKSLACARAPKLQQTRISTEPVSKAN